MQREKDTAETSQNKRAREREKERERKKEPDLMLVSWFKWTVARAVVLIPRHI